MSEDKILERVRLLLARAEHPNTPAPEAELCLAQAHKLMTKHAIDEALMMSKMSEEERRRPVEIVFHMNAETHSEFWVWLRTSMETLAEANRCKAVIGYSVNYPIKIYGFNEDARWVEMLFMHVYFELLNNLHPKWNEELGFDANVYRFKVAGYKWHEINREAMEHGHPDLRTWKTDRWSLSPYPTNHIKSSILTAYRRHAKKIGDTNPVATQSFDKYRHQFAQAFCTRLNARAYEMMHEAKEDYKSSGAELVIADRMEEVRRMLWENNPELDPKVIKERREAAEKEREEMLAAMSDEERMAFLEREERQRRAAAKQSDRYWKWFESNHDSSAIRQGRQAADKVSLDRKGPSVSKEDRKGIQ